MTTSGRHCCNTMQFYVNEACDEHPDPFDCPDRHIYYSARFDEYGLIVHGGSSSYRVIKHCPWCGKQLPESRREEWFATLRALGYDNPSRQEIPEIFLSDAWYAQESTG